MESQGTGLRFIELFAGIGGFGVRRLTPLECERLQGYPEGWTTGQADTARYRQLGNAVAVPVVEWIGRRLAAADREWMAESAAVVVVDSAAGTTAGTTGEGGEIQRKAGRCCRNGTVVAKC